MPVVSVTLNAMAGQALEFVLDSHEVPPRPALPAHAKQAHPAMVTRGRVDARA